MDRGGRLGLQGCWLAEAAGRVGLEGLSVYVRVCVCVCEQARI